MSCTSENTVKYNYIHHWVDAQHKALNGLSHLEDGGELLRGDVDDAVVHELHDGAEVLEGNVLQDDDRVLARVHAAHGPESREGIYRSIFQTMCIKS